MHINSDYRDSTVLEKYVNLEKWRYIPEENLKSNVKRKTINDFIKKRPF